MNKLFARPVSLHFNRSGAVSLAFRSTSSGLARCVVTDVQLKNEQINQLNRLESDGTSCKRCNDRVIMRLLRQSNGIALTLARVCPTCVL